jgi:hypothetical protein
VSTLGSAYHETRRSEWPPKKSTTKQWCLEERVRHFTFAGLNIGMALQKVIYTT